MVASLKCQLNLYYWRAVNKIAFSWKFGIMHFRLQYEPEYKIKGYVNVPAGSFVVWTIDLQNYAKKSDVPYVTDIS